MLAQAAAQLGLHCHVYAPEKDSCAFDVVRRFTVADYTDKKALDAFARDCDVITYEFENVPAECAAFLKSRKPVFPDPAVLENTQDRLVEKEFIAAQKIATRALRAGAQRLAARSRRRQDRPARDAEDPHARLRRQGPDEDRKGRRSGSPPGRRSNTRPASWKASCKYRARDLGHRRALSSDGKVECFDVTENDHRDHILKVSKVPAARHPRARKGSAPHCRKAGEGLRLCRGHGRSRCS